jgi:hypothetical protein
VHSVARFPNPTRSLILRLLDRAQEVWRPVTMTEVYFGLRRSTHGKCWNIAATYAGSLSLHVL